MSGECAWLKFRNWDLQIWAKGQDQMAETREAISEGIAMQLAKYRFTNYQFGYFDQYFPEKLFNYLREI